MVLFVHLFSVSEIRNLGLNILPVERITEDIL
jgi:hypothetical protein